MRKIYPAITQSQIVFGREVIDRMTILMGVSLRWEKQKQGKILFT